MNTLLSRLQRPKKPIDVVLDTDTYNEIDDQFALAYLIKKDELLRLKAIYAAPFFNDNSTDPKDGMEKSYDEIMRILTLMDKEELKDKVYKGSDKYLPDEKTPVTSDVTDDLCSRAMNYTPENPLYVVAIGAITNIASAIIQNPAIIDRIVLVWLGGNAHHWQNNKEFNLMQDVAAARVIFDCGVAVVQLPCMGVVSAFTTTEHELIHWLKGKNKLCDYLVNATVNEATRVSKISTWSRAIWDVTAVAWLLDEDYMFDTLEHSPIPQYDHHYSFDNNRHFIKYVYAIHRDLLFEDLFKTLAK